MPFRFSHIYHICIIFSYDSFITPSKLDAHFLDGWNPISDEKSFLFVENREKQRENVREKTKTQTYSKYEIKCE